MKRVKTSGILGSLALLIFGFFIFGSNLPSASADSPSIVINEIMYHPESGVDNDEFLEIHNTTGATVDLTDWCFTAGISLCFSSGTTIASGAYAIISPNAAHTLSTYGVATIGTYTGKLDNGGETLTLTDNNSNIINSITYDDTPPWPTSPDGEGPSMVLKDPSKDNTLATSWAACPCGFSPGIVNLILTAGLPDIINLSTPQNVLPSASPNVTVEVTNATSVNLVYKVMFGAEQTVTMYDDGAHGDGSSGDGTYGASIPAQAAGKLVRYKVTATNNNGTQTKPGGSDTIHYQGYVVQDSSVTSQIPILQWFMEDSQRNDMIANHSFDDQDFPTVIAYGNTVIDNALIHIKGQTTRGMDKKAFAVTLPKGYKAQFAGMTRAVDEFHLNSSYLDNSGVGDIMAWRLAEEIGMPTTQVFKIRLQNNGGFYGLYTFAEEYDKSWREEFGFQDGSFYKGGLKKTRLAENDGTELQEWNLGVQNNSPQERIDYALRHQDIPNTINLMAFNTFLRNWDVTFGKNWMAYHDINGTDRWKSLPYDLDSVFHGGSAWVAGQHYVTPYEMPGTEGEFARWYRAPLLVLYDDPIYREAYFRRLRTLTDTYLMSGWLNDQFDQLVSETEAEYLLDFEKWGSLTNDSVSGRKNVEDVLAEMKVNLTKRFRKDWAVPAEQSVDPVVIIDDINVNIADRNEDYIVLKNESSESIDMSGWSIPELNYELPPGSVIAAGQSAYIVRKDTVFSANYPAHYVIGEFSQDMPVIGAITLERQNNTQSDMEVII